MGRTRRWRWPNLPTWRQPGRQHVILSKIRLVGQRIGAGVQAPVKGSGHQRVAHPLAGFRNRRFGLTDSLRPPTPRGRLATGFIAYVERYGRAEAAGPKTRFFGGRRGGAVAPGRWPPPAPGNGRARRLTGPGWAVGGSVPAGVCRPDPGGSPASGAGRVSVLAASVLAGGANGPSMVLAEPGCCVAAAGGRRLRPARPGRRRRKVPRDREDRLDETLDQMDQQRGQPIPAAVGGQALGDSRRTVRRTARWRLGGMGWWGSRDEVSIYDVRRQGGLRGGYNPTRCSRRVLAPRRLRLFGRPTGGGIDVAVKDPGRKRVPHPLAGLRILLCESLGGGSAGVRGYSTPGCRTRVRV